MRTHKIIEVFAIFAILITSCSAAVAVIKPNALFSDNAVLQRGIAVPVWGTAADGEKVTVTFQNQRISTTAKDGKWMVRLKPLKEGGPYTMTIEGSNKIELKNILVGEVWLCSGQSNMAFGLSSASNGKEAVAASADTQLRLYSVPINPSRTPVTTVDAAWVESGPQTSGLFSAVGYFFGRELRKALGCPVGLINSSRGSSRSEAWTKRSLIEAHLSLADPRNQITGQEVDRNEPGVLYNGMIAPLIPYAIRGAIWYQGEANRFNAWQYKDIFPIMIRGWRKDWGQGDFPFLFVQIAPYTKIVAEPSESEWADIREAQLIASKSTKNVAMAVITDYGNPDDIHPNQKQPVGERLALAARALAYKEKIPYRGPVYKSLNVRGSKAVVSFDCTDGGLVAQGGELTGFTIAGEDRKFYNASATINGTTVVVSSPDVQKPVAVRYGWAACPVVNLYSGAKLPASPFRTDNWPSAKSTVSEVRLGQPALSASHQTDGICRVGYGRACVTPPMGTPAGKGVYGTLESVIEDIYVRVVYIGKGSDTALIGVADVVGLYRDDIDYFAAGIAQATGLTTDQIILHATHSHSSPGSRFEVGRLLEPFGLEEKNASSQFRKILADGFIAAAKEAVASAEPCTMSYSEAKVEKVASNRRVPIEGTDKVTMRASRSSAEMRAKPEGIIDPMVRLALFKAKSGNSLIGLCNYSCHPSAAGGDLAEYLSADFPGYGMRLAENSIPGLKVMHLTGTCGDINPAAHVTTNSSTRKAREQDIALLGTRYGTALVDAVKSAKDWTEVDASCLHHKNVNLPLASDRLATAEYKKEIEEAVEKWKKTGTPPSELHRLMQNYHAGLRSRNGMLPTRIAAMRLNDIYFTFLPGEIFLRFGQALRDAAPGKLLNTGLCHDYIGYVVPPECFAEGGYEPTATRLAPEAYGVLLEATKNLIKEATQ